MKRKIQILVLLLAAAGCLWLLWQRLFPNDERIIRQRIDHLATLLSVPEHPTLTGNLAAGDRLRDYLATDIELDIDLPGEGRRAFSGRQEIVQLAVATRPGLAGMTVRLLDVQVSLNPDHDQATVSLTGRATLPGRRELFVQEIKLTLRKEDSQWRIAKGETVRTLQL